MRALRESLPTADCRLRLAYVRLVAACKGTPRLRTRTYDSTLPTPAGRRGYKLYATHTSDRGCVAPTSRNGRGSGWRGARGARRA